LLDGALAPRKLRGAQGGLARRVEVGESALGRSRLGGMGTVLTTSDSLGVSGGGRDQGIDSPSQGRVLPDDVGRAVRTICCRAGTAGVLREQIVEALPLLCELRGCCLTAGAGRGETLGRPGQLRSSLLDRCLQSA